ncbi:unnamed protein product [Acanthoscelides obtectus]|uniref:Kynurenine 3-monooxygenase n=2 Tax=Acanthoscelides obtectus TaxID=200917 RepID=A0A9P0PSZ6_ACAOB|nr:unnamed protein product [Acanthoscelides obtectus]CAK1681804.1 Kynurenine 3-monooxygenase [Acanthoscelides obtectus]
MYQDRRKVIVIGGGLVGSLCACFMGQKGYHVVLYEKRSDLRKDSYMRGRSINLAISHRGRVALRSVGLEETVLGSAIPMQGRLLHGKTGALQSMPYDPVFNNCIYSIGRNSLNEVLLNAAENYDNVKVKFDHKLVNADIRRGVIRVQNKTTTEVFEETADLIIGADGAYSVLRSAMLMTPMFQFNQTHIEHGYLELYIPASSGDKMTPNHLHIWPRGQFMMIALPNKDTSWTVTLFMPLDNFTSLRDEDSIMYFFENIFPDAVPLIGKNSLVHTFLSTKPSQLISIKCSPHHFGSKFLIIGDAAHAMVPFYGQGMNSGFEDVSVLSELLDKNHLEVKEIIKLYSEMRVQNVQAVCDLAMYNYVEMRDLVMRKSFRARKAVDEVLYKLCPKIWFPLYNSVSFSSLEYRRCLENKKLQDKIYDVNVELEQETATLGDRMA